MTQDFAKKKRPAPSKKSAPKPTHKRQSNSRRTPSKNNKAPLWAWLVIGLLLATLIVLLVYMANNPPSRHTQATAQQERPTSSKPPQPRFDFYEILKQQRVEVPDHSAEIAANVADNVSYYLQVGSFRNANDADELRAQLLLLNLDTSVERASKQGQTWHRVIVGPFESRSKVAKARSILASNELNPLLLKRQRD